MSAWKVKSDDEAFERLQSRLKDEVGPIFQVTSEKGLRPFWSLIRITFPLAESFADLAYQDESTAKNLYHLLHNEFANVRSDYRGKAATLTLLYRHSLIHQDVPRIVTSGGKTLKWAVTSGNEPEHMTVQLQRGVRFLYFDPHTFQNDLIAVGADLSSRKWNGSVKTRYNEWLALNLDTKAKPTGIEKEAKKEIAAL